MLIKRTGLSLKRKEPNQCNWHQIQHVILWGWFSNVHNIIKTDCVRIYIFNNAKFFENNLCVSKTQLQKGKNVGFQFSKCSNTFNLNKCFSFCM